jgi:hypothetical protein
MKTQSRSTKAALPMLIAAVVMVACASEPVDERLAKKKDGEASKPSSCVQPRPDWRRDARRKAARARSRGLRPALGRNYSSCIAYMRGNGAWARIDTPAARGPPGISSPR